MYQYPDDWGISPPVPEGFCLDTTALMALNVYLSPDLRLENFAFKLFNILEGCDVQINTRAWPIALDPLNGKGTIKLTPSRPSFAEQSSFSSWIDLLDDFKEGRVILVSAVDEGSSASDPRRIVEAFRNRPLAYRWQLALSADGERICLDIRGAVGAAKDLNASSGMWSSANCPTMCWLRLQTTLDLVSVPVAPADNLAQRLRLDPRIFLSAAKNVDIDGLLLWLDTDTSMEPIDKTIFKLANCAVHETLFNHVCSTTPNVTWRSTTVVNPSDAIGSIEMLLDPKIEAPTGSASLKYGSFPCTFFDDVNDPESRTLLCFSYSKSSIEKINHRSIVFSPNVCLFFLTA